MTSQLPVLSLCRTIKALVSKGDHAMEKAEQFYLAAGKHLAELKECCPGEWLHHAKEKIGIGRSRAYELRPSVRVCAPSSRYAKILGSEWRTTEVVRYVTDRLSGSTKRLARYAPTSNRPVTAACRMSTRTAAVAASCRAALRR